MEKLTTFESKRVGKISEIMIKIKEKISFYEIKFYLPCSWLFPRKEMNLFLYYSKGDLIRQNPVFSLMIDQRKLEFHPPKSSRV